VCVVADVQTNLVEERGRGGSEVGEKGTSKGAKEKAREREKQYLGREGDRTPVAPGAVSRLVVGYDSTSFKSPQEPEGRFTLATEMPSPPRAPPPCRRSQMDLGGLRPSS